VTNVLDQNVVTTIWGAIALFGVLVSLMVPRTEQAYSEFIAQGTALAHRRATTWTNATRTIPFVVAVMVTLLTLTAYLGDGSISAGLPPSRSSWIVISAPLLQLVFAIAILLVTTKPREYDLHPLTGVTEPDLRSSGHGHATKLSFVNQRSAPVRYQWLDWQGSHQSRSIVQPDTPAIESTYDGHVFVVEDVEGRVLGYYRARDEPAQIVLRD
jgi:hypothetical protein